MSTINDYAPNLSGVSLYTQTDQQLTPPSTEEADYDYNIATDPAAELPEKAEPKSWKERFPNGISWRTSLWIAAMHVGAIASFWFFSWYGLIACVVMHFVTACLGITLGYHRLLTHRGFETPRIVKYFFSFCGMLSAEGSPCFWVATHRKHHAHSDRHDDPHTPHHGFWWSHFIWVQPRITKAEMKEMMKRWAPDMWKDPVQRFFHRAFALVPFGSALVLFLTGHYLLNGNGWSMLLWGLCLRMVCCYHSTWFVNSATHIWGYRNYVTRDHSRNLWWVALLSYGEGWHNNHHAHQRLARHGHRWWEFDVTYAVIWLMKKTGLAWEVQDRVPAVAPTKKQTR